MNRPHPIQTVLCLFSLVLFAGLLIQAMDIQVASGWTGTLKPRSQEIIDKQRVDEFMGSTREQSAWCISIPGKTLTDDIFLDALHFVMVEVENSGYFRNRSIRSLFHLRRISFDEGMLESSPFIDRDHLPYALEEKNRLVADV